MGNLPIHDFDHKPGQKPLVPAEEDIFLHLRAEAKAVVAVEPLLKSLIIETVLQHKDIMSALAHQLARKLANSDLGRDSFQDLALALYQDHRDIETKVLADFKAVYERDPAAKGYLQPFLFFKGFLALQTQRLGHALWLGGRQTLALYLQSRASELFQVDIHPAVPIGKGAFLDHGTGIVIGETASLDEGVSLLQNVTLGGTGKQSGVRHPQIGRGVLLGAGAKVLGAIQIGDFAKIASGSVVLKSIPAGCTAAGVPARLVNCPAGPDPAANMDQTLNDSAFDYVI